MHFAIAVHGSRCYFRSGKLPCSEVRFKIYSLLAKLLLDKRKGTGRHVRGGGEKQSFPITGPNRKAKKCYRKGTRGASCYCSRTEFEAFGDTSMLLGGYGDYLYGENMFSKYI
jgi:hypothetical protein